MHLFFLLIISLFITQIFRISVLDLFSDVAKTAHLFCVSNLPPQSRSIFELRALVCAENFTHLAQSQLYIKSGLIHLFVVSGAHLLLLEKALSGPLVKKYLPPAFVVLILTAYAFACGLSAPITRALLSFYLSTLLFQHHIRWPFYHRIFFVGMGCLCLQPEWLSSVSLQLSWLAAFILGFTESFTAQRSVFWRQSLFFVVLFPTLVFLQIPTPISIVLNLFFAPVLEFFLFPLGLIVWFLPQLYPAFDATIAVLQYLLQKSELDNSYPLAAWPEWLSLANWALIFLLHLLTQLLHTKSLRKKKLCI